MKLNKHVSVAAVAFLIFPALLQAQNRERDSNCPSVERRARSTRSPTSPASAGQTTLIEGGQTAVGTARCAPAVIHPRGKANPDPSSPPGSPSTATAR
jgi:hypothetical protein